MNNASPRMLREGFVKILTPNYHHSSRMALLMMSTQISISSFPEVHVLARRGISELYKWIQCGRADTDELRIRREYFRLGQFTATFKIALLPLILGLICVTASSELNGVGLVVNSDCQSMKSKADGHERRRLGTNVDTFWGLRILWSGAYLLARNYVLHGSRMYAITIKFSACSSVVPYPFAANGSGTTEEHFEG